MRLRIEESRFAVAACLVSLALYACLSRLPRFWIRGLAYHKTLLLGIAPHIKSHLLYFYHAVLSPAAWDRLALLQMAAVLSLCIIAAEITRKLLGGHLPRFPAVALFAFGYAVIPQSLLALVFWPDGRGRVTALSEVIVVAAVAILQLILLKLGFHLSGREEKKPQPHSGLGLWGYVFVIPTAVLMTLALIISLLVVEGIDALAYHLPLSASLLSTGRTATGPDFQFLYPSNPELAIRWFLTRGNDHLANVVPFLSAIFCIITLYKIGRLLGQRTQSAAIAACCIITIPVVPYLATTAYTDICASMFTLMSVLYLLECWQTKWEDHARIICCGLALGLGLGSKLTAIPASLVVFACCSISLVKDGLQQELSQAEATNLLPRSSWRKIWVFWLTILPGCVYWFIRNLILFGNPVYPAGVLGLPGYPMIYVSGKDTYLEHHSWGLLTYPWVEGDYVDLIDVYSHGIGAVFTAIVIPLLLWWPIYMIRKRKLQMHREARWFLYALAIVFLIYFAGQQTTAIRYAIFMLFVLFFLIGEAWEHMQSIVFKVAVALTFLFMVAGLTETLAGGLVYRFALGFREGVARYDVPPDVDRILPSVILNAAGPVRTYGLMGSDYRHRVIALMRDCTPEDAVRFDARYVLLRADDLPKYASVLRLQTVATSKSLYGENFILCRIDGHPSAGPASQNRS